jgi:hypothetical protein
LPLGDAFEVVEADRSLALGKILSHPREDLVKEGHGRVSPIPIACMTFPTAAATTRSPTPTQNVTQLPTISPIAPTRKAMRATQTAVQAAGVFPW